MVTPSSDPADYEAPLCRSIDDLKGEILNQMEATIDTTRSSKPEHPVRKIKTRNYLDVEPYELETFSASDDVMEVKPDEVVEQFKEFAKISSFFRLGLEGRHREYRNFYDNNKLALTKKEISESKVMERSLYQLEYHQAIDRQKYIRPEMVTGYLWPMSLNGPGTTAGTHDRLLRCISSAFHKGLVHINILL